MDGLEDLLEDMDTNHSKKNNDWDDMEVKPKAP